MRVLLLTHYYAPEVGPPQLRWSALVRDFRAQGHEVHVIAPPPHYPLGRLLPGTAGEVARVGGTAAGAHGETVHRVAWRPSSSSPLSTLVDQGVTAVHSVLVGWRRRRRIAADVVVATAPALPTMAAGWALSRILRRPLVLEMRDAWPDLVADTHPSDPTVRQRLRSWAVSAAATGVRAVQTRADLVVTTTTSFAEVLRHRGVRHVATVRNAYHSLPGEGSEPPGRERDLADPLRIVYIGTIGRAQDLETAVRALRRVRDAGVPARLRVVGTGARADRLRALVAELGVPVEMVGPVPRDRVGEHYRWADTVLITLRGWRGLQWTVPSKLYEALALGIHVSGVVAGEARVIVEETGAGFAVDPGDPRALAQAWLELARTGPCPDRERTLAWVDEHASEAGTSTAYLDLLTGMAADRQRSTGLTP